LFSDIQLNNIDTYLVMANLVVDVQCLVVEEDSGCISFLWIPKGLHG